MACAPTHAARTRQIGRRIAFQLSETGLGVPGTNTEACQQASSQGYTAPKRSSTVLPGVRPIPVLHTAAMGAFYLLEWQAMRLRPRLILGNQLALSSSASSWYFAALCHRIILRMWGNPCRAKHDSHVLRIV